MYFYSHYIRKLFKTIFQREAKYEQTKLQILVHFISPKNMVNTVSIVTGWYYKYIGDIHNYFKTFTTDSSGGTSTLFFFTVPRSITPPSPSPCLSYGFSFVYLTLFISVTCTFVTSSNIITNICIRRLSDQ